MQGTWFGSRVGWALLLLPLAGFLLQCEGRRDIRDYYFPVRDLVNTEGKIYAYRNIGTQPGPDTLYWYYLGVDLDTALYLTITSYGPDLSPRQLSREEITNDGTRLRELSAFVTDTAGRAVPTDMDILYDRTFPFYLATEPERPYGYRLRAELGDRGAETYITLDRRYRRDTTTFILGRERPGILIELAGEVSERDPELGDISPTFTGYEIYTKGLGLTEYYRDLGAAGSTGGRLAAINRMSEFAQRVR